MCVECRDGFVFFPFFFVACVRVDLVSRLRKSKSPFVLLQRFVTIKNRYIILVCVE